MKFEALSLYEARETDGGAKNVKSVLGHGPLKLRTVHLSDNTKIYESKVSVQKKIPLFKGTIVPRPHTKFQINSSFE
jgi:hypothetical protein